MTPGTWQLLLGVLQLTLAPAGEATLHECSPECVVLATGWWQVTEVHSIDDAATSGVMVLTWRQGEAGLRAERYRYDVMMGMVTLTGTPGTVTMWHRRRP